MGVGATVALGALSGGGEQADVVLPANAVLAATFDLDPSASQKIDALRFARKFPQTSGLDWDSGTTPRKWLYERLTADADAAPSWAEVEPWLGDRAGIAVLPPDPGEQLPDAVLALQVTDQEKARASLSALRSGQGPLSGLAGEGTGWCSPRPMPRPRRPWPRPGSRRWPTHPPTRPISPTSASRAWPVCGSTTPG